MAYGRSAWAPKDLATITSFPSGPPLGQAQLILDATVCFGALTL